MPTWLPVSSSTLYLLYASGSRWHMVVCLCAENPDLAINCCSPPIHSLHKTSNAVCPVQLHTFNLCLVRQKAWPRFLFSLTLTSSVLSSGCAPVFGPRNDCLSLFAVSRDCFFRQLRMCDSSMLCFLAAYLLLISSAADIIFSFSLV